MSEELGSIAVIRLGAMGDILHALPAVARLKRAFPESRITWVIAPKWTPLLEGNPHIDAVLPFNRKKSGELRRGIHALRGIKPEVTIDFQGLIQSAVVARLTRARRVVGLARDAAKEPLASTLYHESVSPTAVHIVDCNLELAAAVGAGEGPIEFPIPPGKPEGELPAEPFVLASPFAGWMSKQWPVEYYATLAEMLAGRGIPLVLNVAPLQAEQMAGMRNVVSHTSTLAGLINATRRAAAVVGVDSGPLHLAAALGKAGIGLYGPTDPARNGPYGDMIRVLRKPGTATTWKRDDEIHPAMRALTPKMVFEALSEVMRKGSTR